MRNLYLVNILYYIFAYTSIGKEEYTLAKKKLCQFGKEINHALVDINQPKEWLIEKVRQDTGKYFDRSYLHKIETGELATPGIVASINRVLQLDDNTNTIR